MSKLKIGLSGLLALQIIITVGLYWNHQQQAQQDPQQVLLSFNKDELNRIIINDEDNAVILNKESNHWQLSELGQMPINSGKLDSLLSKLEDLKGGWPVATSQSSQARFEVSDDKFQRRIQLYQKCIYLCDQINYVYARAHDLMQIL